MSEMAMAGIKVCTIQGCGKQLHPRNASGMCSQCRHDGAALPSGRLCSTPECEAQLGKHNRSGMCALCQRSAERRGLMSKLDAPPVSGRESCERTQGGFVIPSDQTTLVRGSKLIEVMGFIPCCGKRIDLSSLHHTCDCGAVWAATFGRSGDGHPKLVRLDRFR